MRTRKACPVAGRADPSTDVLRHPTDAYTNPPGHHAFMTRWSRFLVSSALTTSLLAIVACGTELDDGEHEHEYGDLTYGQGLARGLAAAGSWSPPADVVANADQQQVDYDGAPPYDGGANCASGSTPGARTLKDVLIAAYPQIGSVGIYNCRVIAGTNSMSLHGVGRALDIMIPTTGGDADNSAGDEIAHWLMQNAEMLGLQQIIWDHTIWGVSRSPRVRAYSGSNPHIDHLHVEINEAAAFKNLPWYLAPTGPGPAPACEVVGADGVVDSGPCQQLFGPSQYWRTETAGFGGQLRWTNAYAGDAPSNWARTTVKVATAGRFHVEAWLDPAFARFSETRYRIQGASGESVVVVDQGASAPAGGGFVSLGDFDLGPETTIVVEDNTASAPPTDARTIMVDAFRVRSASTTTEPAPEPTPEPTPDPESQPEPTPEPTPEPVVDGSDDIIDEGDADNVLDSDDPGAAGEIVVEVQGGCSQGESPSALSMLGALMLLGLRRRRRSQ
jgi:uncharacterized protein (TIGR03382 family)